MAVGRKPSKGHVSIVLLSNDLFIDVSANVETFQKSSLNSNAASDSTGCKRRCRYLQGRIQEFTLGGQTKVPNRKLRAKPESRARSARVSRATRVEGAKRLRIEGEARTEGEAREKAGGGVWGGGSVSPSPENF